MFEKEEAEAIVDDHAQEKLKILGRNIGVDFSKHDVLNENSTSRVLLFRNLRPRINNSMLIELASPYGEVTGRFFVNHFCFHYQRFDNITDLSRYPQDMI